MICAQKLKEIKIDTVSEIWKYNDQLVTTQ